VSQVADAARFLREPDGLMVPPGPPVFDAHVHLFPGRLNRSLWGWFDAHAWPVRYRLEAEAAIEFLLRRGVSRFAALIYAHKPGIARSLNRFVADLVRAHSQIVGLGTVLPGEPDAEDIVREALGPLGLRGIKLHSHVQKVAADDPRLDPVYAICEGAQRPVVIHAGREPASEAYGIDTRALCSPDQIGRVLQRYPHLNVIVPHLGADDYDAYAALLDAHDNLYLDTTMAIAGYLPGTPPPALFPRYAQRCLYGSDFPNLPYAWDRELKVIADTPMPDAAREALLWGNASRLFAET
jgi:predicted TIM-barrel fold metal-dependent hydrolase